MKNKIMRNILLIVLVFYSCNQEKNKNIIIIESPLKDQAITIISEGNTRYIINGKHKNIPDSNYAILDISKVSLIGDEIGICWNVDGYKWKLVSAYSRFIKSNLDTSLYYLQKELITDKHGSPTFKEYLDKSCVRISIREGKCLPENGATLTYY